MACPPSAPAVWPLVLTVLGSHRRVRGRPRTEKPSVRTALSLTPNPNSARVEPSVARAGLWQALASSGSCVSRGLGPKKRKA